MNFNEVFTHEPSPKTLPFWMGSVLLKHIGQIVSYEFLAVNVGRGLLLAQDYPHNVSLDYLREREAIPFDEIVSDPGFNQIRGFTPTFVSIRNTVSGDLRPILKPEFVIGNKPFMYGYCLSVVGEQDWRTRLGTFQYLALIDHLLVNSSKGIPLSPLEIREFLQRTLNEKFQILRLVFPDFKRIGDYSEYSEAADIKNLFKNLRQRMAQAGSPFIIPNKTPEGYIILRAE